MVRFGRPPGHDAGVAPQASRRTTGPTLMSTLVAQLAGPPVAPIWLPPLPAAVTLDRAGDGLQVTPDGVRLGVASVDARARKRPFGLPIGLLDDPARQWQGPWLVDLDSSGGHLLVLGGPGSGKTTVLRTLALGLAATRAPTEVGVYGIDLLGSGLRGLSDLPHVGGVAGRDDRERIRRTVDEVQAMLAARERIFTRRIDGHGQLGVEFEDLEASVHDLVARGGRFGVHVVATARRGSEVRAAQQVSFAQRIELRMTDPAESGIDGKLARAVPADVPGRALTSDKLFAHVALPRLDGLPDPATSGLAAAATLVRGAWTGTLPPAVRVLPPVLRSGDLVGAPGLVPFGRFEHDFSTAELDIVGRDQHLLVLGDTACGKTNLLRVLADGLVRRYGPEQLVFAVVDPRHGLAGVVPEPYLGGYAPSATLAQRLAAAVAAQLAGREPGDGAPRVVLLVDDYDVLAASGTQPLAALVPYLASGRDLGLHVLMTRRVMGAARGLFEAFTLGVRESGCLGLVMSGDRTEGQLMGGVRASTMPTGRGRLVRAGEATRTVQTAFHTPSDG
jgi:DNA segregation ATPase FtsK/SpoIIIE, S-DNA-T family